jgi:hypothetical protein
MVSMGLGWASALKLLPLRSRSWSHEETAGDDPLRDVTP